MKKRLVIFGGGDIAQLADFYFTNDSNYEVVAFTVDSAYVEGPEVFGRPMVPFEDIEASFPPDGHELFVALSYGGLNALRRQKFEAGKAKGYALASYLSTRATVWPDFALGDNCFILEDNTLQPYARVGDNVTLWSGNHIGHHSVIGAHCFLASHVVISGGVELGESCFVGVNATVRDHVSIGEQSVIGAGALILGDVEAKGVYLGPATERSRVPSNRLRSI